MRTQKILTAAIVAAACFIGLIVTMGGRFAYFVDVPSLMVVLVFPFLYQSALYGFGGVARAFRAPGDPDATAAELRASVAFFRSYGRATWLFALFASISATIAMLGDIANPATWGPYLAVVLLCLLYAAMLNLLLSLPYAAHAARRLAEFPDDARAPHTADAACGR
ncbi:hypothetical protein LJC31_00635 [Synergistaceae bacterium OttesenSCG-928-I11]|nr:hypothetical protein [Synergistaceae bacterium OttesenSCG-928-I11]